MSQTNAVSPRFPVSIKGVLICDGKVLLRKNERREWELIGGKLEYGEEPPVTLAREWEEETVLSIEVGPLVDAWVYHVAGVDVLIVVYHVHMAAYPGAVTSPEGSRLEWFSREEIHALPMPDGYKRSIELAISRMAH